MGGKDALKKKRVLRYNTYYNNNRNHRSDNVTHSPTCNSY